MKALSFPKKIKICLGRYYTEMNSWKKKFLYGAHLIFQRQGCGWKKKFRTQYTFVCIPYIRKVNVIYSRVAWFMRRKKRIFSLLNIFIWQTFKWVCEHTSSSGITWEIKKTNKIQIHTGSQTYTHTLGWNLINR